jgi:hydroxymethylglutaryl-CoA reductase
MSRTFIKVIENDKNWSKNLTKKKPSANEVPRGYGKKSIEERWKVLNKSTKYLEYYKELEKNGKLEGYKTPMEELLDKDTMQRCDIFKDNIENFIGTVKIPLGNKIINC